MATSATVSRQLAAIMFTDIVGYTALMGSDERHAFDLLHKSRQIQQPIIQNHGGKWIKELGDGVLASFQTATNAVQSALQILQECNSIPDLNLRIGIHLGDIVFENNDVFGDGVNIASRLLQQAKPGTLIISGSVYDSVANKKGICCNYVGEEMLKNVREPIRLYQVEYDADGSFIQHKSYQQKVEEKPVSVLASEKSIAVLPFVNMSNDPEQEYFSDGITEEILNALAQVKDLHVAGRTSSFYFKNKNYDLRKIGQKLNVQKVLEGSVRRQGNKLRITAQLINVHDGYHLWSEKYDRPMDDFFAIQDEIALAITEKLKITLSEGEREIIQTAPTTNQEAYDLYLKGRFYFNKRGKNIVKAIQFFQQALQIDPEFSLPYTGLADSYCILCLYCVIAPGEAMPKARQLAEKALYVHHIPAEAQTALAFVTTFYDWNWKEAKNIFTKIFETHPRYAPAHYWYSYYLSFVERDHDEAIRHAKMATEDIEPLVPIAHHILSIMYFNAGEYEHGVNASGMAIQLDETSFPGYRGLGLNYAGLKKYDEAIEAFKKAVHYSERQPLPMGELCWTYHLMGNTEEIQKIFDELLLRSETEYISSFLLCSLTWFLGRKDESIKHLEQAFNNRDSGLVVTKTYLPTEFMRSEPELKKYIDKMQFPD